MANKCNGKTISHFEIYGSMLTITSIYCTVLVTISDIPTANEPRESKPNCLLKNYFRKFAESR